MNEFSKYLETETKSSNVFTRLVEITPKMAESILKEKNINNRQIQKSTVAAYAVDILNDNWKVTNQGIGFYKNGMLADGQHRLSAIVKANKPVTMQVTFGLDKDSINGIDQRKIRYANEVLTMSGGYGIVSKNDIAAIRLCCDKPKLSVSTIENVYIELSECLDIVKKMIPYNCGFSGSPVNAALILAIYRCELVSTVKEFAGVLVDGISYKPEHEIIIRLRDYILKTGLCRGGSQRKKLMKQVMWTLESFAKGEKRKRLIEPVDYAYKLFEIQ